MFPGAHKTGAAIAVPRIPGNQFYGQCHKDLSELKKRVVGLLVSTSFAAFWEQFHFSQTIGDSSALP